MGVTGLEPVPPGPAAGNGTLMDVVSALLALADRVMQIWRAQETGHVAKPLPRNDR